MARVQTATACAARDGDGGGVGGLSALAGPVLGALSNAALAPAPSAKPGPPIALGVVIDFGRRRNLLATSSALHVAAGRVAAGGLGLGGTEGRWLCAFAARAGALDVLVWLRDRAGAEWDALVCAKAAEGGHVGVLQWARERGCAADHRTCAAAAASAHEDGALACLKFAREEGIEWDEHVVGWAAEVGNHEILRYALRRKAPQPEFWVRPEGLSCRSHYEAR